VTIYKRLCAPTRASAPVNAARRNR